LEWRTKVEESSSISFPFCRIVFSCFPHFFRVSADCRCLKALSRNSTSILAILLQPPSSLNLSFPVLFSVELPATSLFSLAFRCSISPQLLLPARRGDASEDHRKSKLPKILTSFSVVTVLSLQGFQRTLLFRELHQTSTFLPSPSSSLFPSHPSPASIQISDSSWTSTIQNHQWSRGTQRRP